MCGLPSQDDTRPPCSEYRKARGGAVGGQEGRVEVNGARATPAARTRTRRVRNGAAGARDRQGDVRMLLRRLGKVSVALLANVSETPYGWKAKWAPVVDAHRTSILELLALKPAN